MSKKVKALLLVLFLLSLLIGGFVGTALYERIHYADLQNKIAVPYDTDDLAQSCANATAAGRRASPQCYADFENIYRTSEFREIEFIYEGEGR